MTEPLQRDRAPLRRVGSPMPMPALAPRLCAALTALALVACGGKPGTKGTGTPTGSASDSVPQGGEDSGSEDGQESEPGDGITPPGVDLSPAERKARTEKHLVLARRALSGADKDPDLAIRETKAALGVVETHAEAMLLLAHANYLKGYYDLADEVLDRAVVQGAGTDKKLWFLRGLVAEKTERDDEAFAAFDRAVSIDPSYKPAVLNLGVYYLENKRYQQAVALYERLTGELGYKRAVAWTNLASAYRGRAAELQATDPRTRDALIHKAEAAYQRALSVDRNYGPAHYNLGLLYLDSDPYPTAKGDMDRLARLKTAKSHFDDYRRMPGADQKLADEQIDVAQKLYEKEEKVREKQRKLQEMEQKLKQAEAGGGGFE